MKPNIICVIVGILSLSTTNVLAESNSCYEVKYERTENPIKRIMMLVSPLPNEPDEDNESKNQRLIEIFTEYWGKSNLTLHTSGAVCREDGNCNIDCNAGSATIKVDENKVMHLTAVLLSSSRDAESIVLQPGRLSGTFEMKQKPTEICMSIFPKLRSTESHYAIYQPGDINPIVKLVETNLAKLGYLAETPDYFMTLTTEDALKRFQKNFGLPITGRIDRIVIDRLRYATLSGC